MLETFIDIATFPLFAYKEFSYKILGQLGRLGKEFFIELIIAGYDIGIGLLLGFA